MRLEDYAAPDLIGIGLIAANKEELLAELVQLLVTTGRVQESDELMQELLKRENVMSTGIGGGIAIPHALSMDINDLYLVFARTEKPVDFQALDAKPVDLVFMLVGPKTASSIYVKLLARVSRLLQNEDFKDRLRHAARPEEIMDAFRSEAEYAA